MQALPANKYSKIMTNDKLNITGKTEGTRNCKKKDANYAAQCSKYKVRYIWHAWKWLPECFSKHRYDIKNRPDNSKLTKYVQGNLNVTILQNNIKTVVPVRYPIDFFVCKVMIFSPLFHITLQACSKIIKTCVYILTIILQTSREMH